MLAFTFGANRRRRFARSLVLSLIIAVSLSGAAFALEVFSSGMGVPEAIVQVPSSFIEGGGFLVPDATLKKIWRVPQNGGTPVVFSANLGINAIGGLFLPSNWEANAGKFLTSGFVGDGSSKILIFESNGDFAIFLNQAAVTFADAVIAPSSFGTLGGNLLVADEGGKVWVVTPAAGSTQLGPNLGFLAFGVTFVPAGFGTVGGKLLVSRGDSGDIVALDASGTVTPFITLVLEPGQRGLRQMAFSPAGFIPGVGTLLFVSVSGSQFGGGTLGDVLALDSSGTTVFSLRRDLGLTTFDPRGLLFTAEGLLVNDASVGKILRITSQDFAFVDTDGDGVPNIDDNCLFTYNPDQADKDGDGVGDACDNCPINPGANQTDSDGDGLGDTVCGVNSPGGADYAEALTPPAAGQPGSATNPAQPGEPLVVTATFTNTSGQNILTIRPDCINTTFTVTDGEDILPPRYRHRAYGIPDDLVTILANAQFSVTCDLSEMFHPSVLTDPIPGDAFAASYTVQATYSNYIQDRDIVNGVCTSPPCSDLWIGSVTSAEQTVFIQGNPATRVDIDIKPGSFPNSINLGSGGTVPVAIFSTATFNATTIDPLSVTLAGATVKLKGKGTPMASFQDVNGDGLLDLVVHVSTEALELTGTDTVAVLEGTTSGGIHFVASATVRIVP